MLQPVHQPPNFWNILCFVPEGVGDVLNWAGKTHAYHSAPIWLSYYSDYFSSFCSSSCPYAHWRVNGANRTLDPSRPRLSYTGHNPATSPTIFRFPMVIFDGRKLFVIFSFLLWEDPSSVARLITTRLMIRLPTICHLSHPTNRFHANWTITLTQSHRIRIDAHTNEEKGCGEIIVKNLYISSV